MKLGIVSGVEEIGIGVGEFDTKNTFSPFTGWCLKQIFDTRKYVCVR